MAQSHFVLTSSNFQHNQLIPEICTCDGKDGKHDISPELHWANPPQGTKSFVLIVDDPDAPVGTWDHWILFNIPYHVNHLLEGLKELPKGTKRGLNSWGKVGYGGPCPPDKEHRYFFTLYALNTILDLEEGATKSVIKEAIIGHIIEETSLIGKYDLLKRR